MAADPTPAERWASAYVNAQADFPEVKKGRTVTIETSKGRYSYNYADLPTILELVQPILAKHNLAVAQGAVTDEAGRVGVTTRIIHSGGHIETFGPLFLDGGDDPKAAGSAVTYARRYSLCAALGIAADEDDDATSATESRRQEASVPTSPDEPHCPACLAVNGELVGLWENDKRPFWKCKAKEACAAWDGSYAWSGWHKSFENSVADYTGGVIVESPTETLFDNGRAARSPYIVENTMRLAGLPNDTDAKLLVKPGLILAISQGSVDVVAALGAELGTEPSDEELRVVIGNLTLAEADAVAACAASLRTYDENDPERPFE